MASDPATSELVVQVHLPLPFTATAVQPLMAEPLAVKLIVPEGAIGVTPAAASETVKVTAWFTLDEAGSEETMLDVAARALTVCVSVPGVLTVKFASPA